MKINIVSRKFIKPFTPTPQNLKNYQISFKDELNSPMNVGIVLFYKSRPKSIGQLEESLSKILPNFYPLAGRYIKNDHCVDCSDQGAEFVEALVADNVGPTDFLEFGGLEGLVPRRSDRVDGMDDPLLSIQITQMIVCGALAIGKNLNLYKDLEPSKTTIVAKRFVFNKEAIMSLKSKLSPKSGHRLSRLRAMCAVVAKALIRLDQRKHRRPRPCLMIQAVNMRQRTIPPLPKHSCGNLVLNAVAECFLPKIDLKIQELVHILSDAIGKTISDCAEVATEGEDGHYDVIIKPEVDLIKRSKSPEVNALWFTDWSKFGLYEADFGWGKPVGVGVAPMPMEKLAVLVNGGDGEGIEAWVHLSPSDMSYFEEDEEINLFTI